MNKSLGFWLGFICLLQAPDCGAQEQQSFKTLVGRGFEIKSVTFARGESTDNRDSFLVTLQKDKSVAVCIFRGRELDQHEQRHPGGRAALRRPLTLFPEQGFQRRADLGLGEARTRAGWRSPGRSRGCGTARHWAAPSGRARRA